MLPTAASSRSTTMATNPRRGLGVATWSQFFYRTGVTAGLVVIGAYLADLANHGEAIDALAVGAVTVLAALAELVFAPISGAVSDRYGRKWFLFAGPALAVGGSLLPPLELLRQTLPPVGLVITLLAAMRLLEGIGGAISAPATLSFLAETTDGRPYLRGRQMSLYELASAGGVGVGAFAGAVLSHQPLGLGLASFFVLAGIYAIGALLTLLVREGDRANPHHHAWHFRRYLAILTHRQLAWFIPAWVAANALLGVWLGSVLPFVLQHRQHVAGQHFVGSLADDTGDKLGSILGGYVLWFSLCVVVWALFLGRLPKLPVLLVTLSGSIIASIGLIALNHGLAVAPFVGVVMVGVFLEAGVTPSALAYLADQSQVFTQDRGLVMGLYSILLGLGHFLGLALASVAAHVAYFDGLGYLTMGLALMGMLSVTLLLTSTHARPIPMPTR
jgi:MFS family permease